MTDDHELDSRIERALHARAGDAPTSGDLAGRLASTARGRVHRRRNRRIGAAAAIAVVATLGGVWSAIGGPESFTASNDSASGGSAERQPEPIAPTAGKDSGGSGWRWESYGGVQLQVPAGWGYGVTRAPWCSAGAARQADGEVGRPGSIGYVKCPDPVPATRRGQHVWFSRDESVRTSEGIRDLGAGWSLTVRTVGEIQIEVQTHDPAVRDQILASIREVTTDLNRCPVTHRISTAQPVQPSQGLPWDDSVNGVSICGYVGDQQPGPGLTGSRRLEGAAAQQLLDAIRAAPPGGGPDDPGQREFAGGGTVLRFDTADGVREVFVRYDSGAHNGFDNGTSERRLTRDALTFLTGPLLVTAGPRETLILMPRR